MRYTFIVFYVLMNLSCAGQGTGTQKQFNFSIGVGMTDWYNLAFKYQVNQTQFGASYGTMFYHDSDDKLMVLSIFGYKHLFGQSKLTERKPWFARAGISYLRKEYSNELRNRNAYSSIYFGRDINVSRRIGFAISCGPAVLLYSKYEYEESNKSAVLLPGMDVNVFYRFL